MAETAPDQIDATSIDLLGWVDEIADQFEAAWRSLTPPRLEDFLGAANGEARAALVEELAKIDRVYRSRMAAPSPTADASDSTLTRAAAPTPLPPLEPSPVPGEDTPVLPGYEVLGLLGRGGMGVVYKARQRSLPRLVALKMLPAGFGTGRQRQRFVAEARAVARLRHLNIVQIYEVGEHDGRPFFALEYVAGGSLAQQLDGDPQPARPAAQLVETLARAVQYAHEQGIVHRDLKPGNVLLSLPLSPVVGGEGLGVRGPVVPKITDFGLAKQLDSESPAGPTLTGEILGTPSYMAPEQAEGKPGAVGQAVDIYALGAILYELLTGRPPFRGATMLDTLEQVRTQEPLSPSRLQPKLARDLGTICLKCLQKEPSKRYASAGELADDLHGFLDGRPIHARPVSHAERLWRWCRRYPAVAGLGLASALFLIAGTGVSVYYAFEENARAREAKDNARTAELARKNAQRESALLGLERGRHLAEQGQGGHGLLWLARSLELATEAEDPELPRIVRTNLAAVSRQLHTLRQVIPTGSERADCALTPDGKKVWVSSQTNSDVRLWDAATGQPEQGLPLDHAQVFILALSPDGTVLFTSGRGKSRLWDTATRRPHGPLLSHATQVRSAAFRPDGRILATGHVGGTVRLWDVATEQLRAEWQGHESEVLGAAFSPDGKTLATGNNINGNHRLWDGTTGKPLGEPIAQPGEVFALTWSRDGEMVLVGNAMGTVQFWDVATSQRRGQPLAHRATILSMDISRDGRLIATGCADRTARLWDAASRQPLANFLPHQGSVSSVALGPEGKMLATASADGFVRIWDLAPRRVELPHRSWVYTGIVSSDGRTALTGCGLKRAQLWDAATGQPLGPPFQHPEEVCAAVFLPEGRGFFTGCVNGQLWRWELSPTRAGTKLDAHGGIITSLAISPDGCTLVSGGDDKAARLWDVTTGQPRGAPLRHDGEVAAVAFSLDGRTVLTGSRDKTARLWDVASGQPLGTPLAHPDEVVAVAFHPDGSRFFTASRDTGVRVWDAATRQPIGKPLTLQRALTSMALSPSSQSILLGSADGRAQLFDLATGLPLGLPFSHERAVRSVTFAPDGRTALTTSQDTTARLWEVPSLVEGDPQRIGLWVQVITGLELKADGMVSVLDGQSWQDRRQRLQSLGGPPRIRD